MSEQLKTWKEREKEHLEEVLKITSWDIEKASRLLQIAVSQVKRKIKEHELTRPKSP